MNYIMDSIFSFIIFFCVLILYYRIVYYYTYNDKNILMVIKDVSTIKLPSLMSDIGQLKLPGVFNNESSHSQSHLSYDELLLELSGLTLTLPFLIKESERNILLTMDVDEFIENDPITNGESLLFDPLNSRNKSEITVHQKEHLERLFKNTEGISQYYLYNQKVVDTRYTFLFSNTTTKSYTPLQYYKTPLNIFYVLDGNCTFMIGNPSLIGEMPMINDYTFFRFYIKGNSFDDLDYETTNNINLVKCTKGDYIVVPNQWLVGIEMEPKSAIMRESSSTLTSIISLTPEYIKHYICGVNVNVSPIALTDVDD